MISCAVFVEDYYSQSNDLLQQAFETEKQRYNDSIEGLANANTKKLEDARAFVAEYNSIMAGLGAGEEAIEEPSAPLFPQSPVYSGGGIVGGIPLPQYANGGPINEPTLLYGLRSKSAYAIAGEAGPERVSPGGGISVIVEMDGRPIAEGVAPYITETIRLKTGIKK